MQAHYIKKVDKADKGRLRTMFIIFNDRSHQLWWKQIIYGELWALPNLEMLKRSKTSKPITVLKIRALVYAEPCN
jgi:hypothetical protein